MTIKIKPERVGPPSEKRWLALNGGASIEVAGLRYRRTNVVKFIQGAHAAGHGNFGIQARRQKDNPHSPFATAIHGWWIAGGLFGRRRSEQHLGFLPEWAAQNCLAEKDPEPEIYVDLYSCYLGHDGFVDVDIIVHVEMSAAEILENEATKAAAETVRALRKQCAPGLKLLAHMAAMSGRPENPAEMTIMREYVTTRAGSLSLTVSASDIEQIVTAAAGLAPSDQAVMTAIRGLATDDRALEDVFRAGLAMGRLDGVESPDEVRFLKRVLATAGRRRAKSRQTPP